MALKATQIRTLVLPSAWSRAFFDLHGRCAWPCALSVSSIVPGAIAMTFQSCLKAVESFKLVPRVFHLSTPKGKTLGKRLWRVAEENLFSIGKTINSQNLVLKISCQTPSSSDWLFYKRHPIDSSDWLLYSEIPQLITTFLIFCETWRSDWQHN